MFQNIGVLEIAIIAIIILLLFGAKKLPEFARGLVEAKKEFKDSFTEKDDDNKSSKKE